MSVKIYDSQLLFKYLNGILVVYKPAGKKVTQVRNAILYKICKGLNELEVREPRRLVAIGPGGVQNQILKNISDISDDILAVGERYQMQDFKCRPVASLGVNTSGVLLLGLNKGIKLAEQIQKSRLVRMYNVTGKLGIATENHCADSIITACATYKHITANRLASMVASLQASHQRKMYELSGVDIQSQAAYELASQGLIRPANNIQPVIYGIKLIKFFQPFFTLQICAINEMESYLATLIHEIGIELKSVAHCCKLQCIRHGVFTVEDALLKKDWSLQQICNNLSLCNNILKENPKIISQKEAKISEDFHNLSVKKIE